MKYSIYISNGQIVRLLDCDNIQDQIADGENYLSDWFLDSEYYVENGLAVKMPEKPNDFVVFNYTTKQWADPRTPQTQWPIVIQERKLRLLACDWTQLADIPPETKVLWEPYRQALRDITKQADPFNIVWPTKPK
jgi:hypothetical protein